MQNSGVSIDSHFSRDYQLFSGQYDQILAESSFRGEQLELMSKNFIAKHEEHLNYLRKSTAIVKFRYPNCSAGETLDEDLAIVNSEIQGKQMENNSYDQLTALLADLYRRLCQACYLRVTFNKSRLNKEDNRDEALGWARYAIRCDPSDFGACCWYMISLGWRLEATTNPRDRTLIARIFRDSARRCIELRPSHPLAHNLLGRYYYSVASLSWFERTAAKGLLGCKLEGSFEEAEREFRLAHQLRADWLPNGLWMARVLLAQSKPMGEVRDWIEFGLSLECHEPTSEIERVQLLELQAKCRAAK